MEHQEGNEAMENRRVLVMNDGIMMGHVLKSEYRCYYSHIIRNYLFEFVMMNNTEEELIGAGFIKCDGPFYRFDWEKHEWPK